jgi:prophage regulatory protein
MTTLQNNPLALLRRPQVELETGLGRSAIYHGMQNGTFPRAIRITANCVAWRRKDIDQWLCDPLNYRADPEAA